MQIVNVTYLIDHASLGDIQLQDISPAAAVSKPEKFALLADNHQVVAVAHRQGSLLNFGDPLDRFIWRHRERLEPRLHLGGCFNGAGFPDN
ncbi:hypothetical protein D3C78_1366320 [compost metagenome]